MQKINCDVNNCSHNSSGVCFSNRVDIAGMGSSTENNTCCGAFLNKLTYGDLSSSCSSSSACDCLVCKVTSCSHNDNCLCSLDSINVSGNDTNLYSETTCQNFDLK